MADMGDDFRAWKQAKVEKRASNRLGGAALLTKHGIAFDTRNDGAHLLVRHEGRTIDFWPGTGRWIDRAHPFSCINGRGVFRLLKHMGVAAVDRTGAKS
jgi:hypothetical protein